MIGRAHQREHKLAFHRSVAAATCHYKLLARSLFRARGTPIDRPARTPPSPAIDHSSIRPYAHIMYMHVYACISELMGLSDRATTGLLLPPSFRFCPIDEEPVAHYLARKAADANFASAAVLDVDLYRSEPWDLLLPPCDPTVPATGADEERYFACTRSVKYPSGLRTNWTTAAGYWKYTGKDKEVLRHGDCGGGEGRPVGVKKMLLFYRGRAPKGEKINWITLSIGWCMEHTLLPH